MSDLILPQRFQQQQMRERVRDLILDFLYKHIRSKKTNVEIQALLRKKGMPPMDASEINTMREFFKQAESEHPAKMAEFRRNLKVA